MRGTALAGRGSISPARTSVIRRDAVHRIVSSAFARSAGVRIAEISWLRQRVSG